MLRFVRHALASTQAQSQSQSQSQLQSQARGLTLFRHVVPIPPSHRAWVPPLARSLAQLSGVVKAAKAPPPPPTTPPKITLREYQEECIQAVLAYLDAGHKRLGISLATGAGKTVIFTHLIDRISATGIASQTLILAHRRELVEQAARHCALVYPDKHVDVEMGKLEASGSADITVASIQSITSGNRLHKFDPSRYKLILVDEAHHIVSQTYLDVLQHFGLRDAQDWSTATAPALVGVSATFSRFDGRRLGAVIDHIVYHRDYVDMIEENWLTNVIFTTVKIKADLTKLGTGANGDFQTGALSKAINTPETNDILVKSWAARAKDRHSTLVFCVDLSHVASLTAKFREYGVDAQFVTGDTPAKIRSARVDAFRNKDFPVLLNCGVFTEGTDIPNIDCVLLARPTKSRNLLIQMIGRGMRLYTGKDNCHVIDMVAALSTGVVSTPTLFGLDPGELVQEADTKTLTQLKERKESERSREEEAAATAITSQTVAPKLPGSVTFTDYDSIHELIADTSGDQYIRNLSQYAWVGVGDGKYVLSTNSGNYLTITASDEKEGYFTAKYHWKLPADLRVKSPYGRPRTVVEADSFEHVVHAADTFAADAFEHMWVAKAQPWRKGRASQAQIDFLNKHRPEQDQLKPEDVTKGKATDMIIRLKHGAKGRFDKATSKSRGVQRVQQRAETLRQRLQGMVHVGPLEQWQTIKKKMLG